jgi:hypothetical protein
MASYCCTLATASYCCTYCCTRTNEGRSHDRNRPLSWVEPRGFEPLTSWLQISARPVYGGRWSRPAICGSPARPLAADGVAVLRRCMASCPVSVSAVSMACSILDNSAALSMTGSAACRGHLAVWASPAHVPWRCPGDHQRATVLLLACRRRACVTLQCQRSAHGFGAAIGCFHDPPACPARFTSAW